MRIQLLLGTTQEYSCNSVSTLMPGFFSLSEMASQLLQCWRMGQGFFSLKGQIAFHPYVYKLCVSVPFHLPVDIWILSSLTEVNSDCVNTQLFPVLTKAYLNTSSVSEPKKKKARKC